VWDKTIALCESGRNRDQIILIVGLSKKKKAESAMNVGLSAFCASGIARTKQVS